MGCLRINACFTSISWTHWFLARQYDSNEDFHLCPQCLVEWVALLNMLQQISRLSIFNREGIVIYIQFHPSFVDERSSKDQWCTFTIHLFLQILLVRSSCLLKVVHWYVCVPFKGHTIGWLRWILYILWIWPDVCWNKHA